MDLFTYISIYIIFSSKFRKIWIEIHHPKLVVPSYRTSNQKTFQKSLFDALPLHISSLKSHNKTSTAKGTSVTINNLSMMSASPIMKRLRVFERAAELGDHGFKVYPLNPSQWRLFLALCFSSQLGLIDGKPQLSGLVWGCKSSRLVPARREEKVSFPTYTSPLAPCQGCLQEPWRDGEAGSTGFGRLWKPLLLSKWGEQGLIIGKWTGRPLPGCVCPFLGVREYSKISFNTSTWINWAPAYGPGSSRILHSWLSGEWLPPVFFATKCNCCLPDSGPGSGVKGNLTLQHGNVGSRFMNPGARLNGSVKVLNNMILLDRAILTANFRGVVTIGSMHGLRATTEFEPFFSSTGAWSKAQPRDLSRTCPCTWQDMLKLAIANIIVDVHEAVIHWVHEAKTPVDLGHSTLL